MKLNKEVVHCQPETHDNDLYLKDFVSQSTSLLVIVYNDETQ